MRPLKGSLVGKTKVNNCTVRCRGLDKVLTHEGKVRVSHPDLPDSGFTQNQPEKITVSLENITFWAEASSLAISVIHSCLRASWLPAPSKEVKKINKLKLHLYHIRLPQDSPRDQVWRLYNSSASSRTPGIARGCPSDLQEHRHLERAADRHWQTDCQHKVLGGCIFCVQPAPRQAYSMSCFFLSSLYPHIGNSDYTH